MSTALEQITEALSPLAAQMGAELPEATVPAIDLTWSVGKRMARELGQYLAQCGIYLQGTNVVTINDLGQTVVMIPERFTSWVERHVLTFKWFGGAENAVKREMTMSVALARQILESDQFREVLWPLKGVHPVRMPVRRENGTYELLEPGYDQASGILTLETVTYRLDMTADEARGVLARYLVGFPWADGYSGDPEALFRNRSVGVQVGAMLGAYCRGVFAPGTKRPMLLYLANQPGSGKSLLAAMALLPVFGHASTTGLQRDEEKFAVTLETVAQSFAPYAFFDDLGGGVFSNSLNKFLTSSSHSGRKFHSNSEMFSVPNVTQIIATGNGIELQPDLERRSMVIDLFLAGEVRGRQFDFTLDESYVAQPEHRSELLAAYWALVRDWIESGSPVPPDNLLPTFEAYTATISGIVTNAGFADPLIRPDLPDGGDKQGRFWRLFLAHLAGDMVPSDNRPTEITIKQMLAKVEELAEADILAIEDLVGDTAKKPEIAFGKRIAKWRARHITDTRGRVVQFGKRDSAKSRAYRCEVLAPAQ